MPMSPKRVSEMLNTIQARECDGPTEERKARIREAGLKYITEISAELNDSRHASEWFTNFEHAHQSAITAVELGAATAQVVPDSQPAAANL